MKHLNAVLLLLLSVLAVPHVANATQNTANALVFSKSVQILPSQAQFVAGYGDVTNYFSTFNGTYGSFLVGNGGALGGELRPRSGTTNLYEGAFEQATPLAVLDYGSYVVTGPITDSTGVGIPDVLNYTKGGDFAATGSGYSAAFGVTFSCAS